MVGWLDGWLLGRLVRWLFGLMVVGGMVGWFVFWLIGRMVGWIVGWMKSKFEMNE